MNQGRADAEVASLPLVDSSSADLVTQRQAITILRSGRHHPTQRLAMGLLNCGFAGPARRAGGALLYDAARVQALADRKQVQQPYPELCRGGMLVLRLPGRSGLALAPIEDVRAELQRSRPMSATARLQLSAHRARFGMAPVIATVAGHVLGTAELEGCTAVGGTAADGTPIRDSVLQLSDPGAWAAAFLGRVLRTPPGNAWLWWAPSSRQPMSVG